MGWELIIQTAQTTVAIVATAAAIWAAYDARRSRKIAESAVRPVPIVTATIIEESPFDDYDATIYIEIRNRADVALTVRDVETRVPGYELTGGEQRMDCALHVERLREKSDKNEKALVLNLSRNGSRHSKRPSLILRMQWRDQSVKTFAIKVMITQISVMTDSQ